MKRKNKKLLTLILCGALCATSAVGAVTAANLSANADDEAAKNTVLLTDVFAGSSGDVIGAEKIADGDEKETAAFTLKDKEYVYLKRDLAFKWFEAKDTAKYLNFTIVLKDLNFTKLSFRIESAAAEATKDEKAVNILYIRKDETGYKAGVTQDEETNSETETAIALTAGAEVKFELAEHADYGKFTVKANGTAIGEMENVGANFAEYEYSESYSLYLQAETETGSSTTVYLKEINGQLFNNIENNSDSKKVVTDTAAPVLVVNDELSGFLLGTQFSLNYEKIDVLTNSGLTETKEYYQYNPEHTETKYTTLTTSTYFMDTVYEKDGKETSVWREYEKEYVSVKFTLGDAAHSTSETKVVYELAWYATSGSVEEKTLGEDSVAFIIADRNEDGPEYRGIKAEKDSRGKYENKYDDEAAFNNEVEAYQAALEAAAENVSAGSNSYVYFPSLDWLISDNNGYRSLKFTISYKTPSSTSSKTSSGLSHSSLKLSASEPGTYEFKVFAKDKAGNVMKYADEDGNLVEVTESNIWDIEAIPAFSYAIKNKGISVEEKSTTASDRVKTQLLSETYTFTDATIVGASDLQSDYALYKVDVSKYKDKTITQAILSSVTSADIQSAIKSKIPTTSADGYFELYISEYAKQVAGALGVSDEASIAAIKKCFVKIDEYDDRISEEENASAWEASDNKYNWQPSSKSFTAAEQGTYLVLADYWEGDMARVDRVPAYKLIVVSAETDVIKGETQWLQNNLVSVILFSVAAVMLILIVVLLLVQPSEETLSDVDAKAAKKKNVVKKK